MNTLNRILGLGSVKSNLCMGLLSLFLTACGGGSSGSVNADAIPTDELVQNLFSQFDNGQITEDQLIAQLQSLGF